MSDFDVSIDYQGDAFNNVIMTVRRRLDEAEARQLYKLLAEAYSDGWHDHRVEVERQKADPSHPITSRNPYRGGQE